MTAWVQILALLCFFYGAGAESAQNSTRPAKQNVILMVSDGMGPSGLTLARTFKQYRDQLPLDEMLNIENHLVGTLRTYSSSNLVTDSAAAGTALHCGQKTYNGAIAVDSDKKPVASILEALKLEGYLTGLVVTTRITDATPATLSAHVNSRKQEDEIAEQQLNGSFFGSRMVDLMLGGGRCHFFPKAVAGGCRKDDKNLIDEAVEGNYTYVEDREGFDALRLGNNVSLPLLGLLAPKDIPYEIDRNASVYPSLAELTKTALTSLGKAAESSDKGFFLMIEGSRIDHAGHDNDAAAHVEEVLAYDEAFQVVKDFIDASETPTFVVSTSDHETGGLSVARQVGPEPNYSWYPEVLVNGTHSGEYLVKKIADKQANATLRFIFPEIFSFITDEIFEHDLGILDYTEEETKEVLGLAQSPKELMEYLNQMVSSRSQTGWTTGGHSAVDVTVYTYANDKYLLDQLYLNDGLVGNHDNTEIASFVEKITGVNLNEVTQELNAKVSA